MISRVLGGFLHLVPVVGVLVNKAHIGQGLAVLGNGGLALNWPFSAAVPFALLEALPDKVAGGKGKGQGDVAVI